MGCFSGVEQTWASQLDVGRTHIATKGTVQSGLVLNLDAGASSSYSGTGNTWNDLSVGTGALPIYNTTNSYGTVKGTGTRTDSNASSLVLAIPMDGTNNGTTFTDESANIRGSGSAKSITRNGDTKTLTAVSKFYGSSGFFDGAGVGYLVSNGGGNLGSGDFTIELWTYLISRNSIYPCFFGNYDAFGAGALSFFAGHISYNTSKYTIFANGSGTPVILSSSVIIYNSWAHLAVVRSGSTLTLYINGIADSSGTISGTLDGLGGTAYIGASGDVAPQSFLNGYLQDFRIYKGLAKYTSNFIPFGNPNNGTLVNSPSYNSRYGGFLVFNGSSQYATTPAINLTTAGTVSAWFYKTGTGTPDGANVVDIFSNVSSNGANGWSFGLNTSTNKINFYIANNGGFGVEDFSTQTISNYTWYNVVVTYNGSNKIIYINGVQDSTFASSVNGNATTNWSIGSRNTGARNFQGNIAQASIYNRALSAAEVSQNYNALRNRYVDPFVNSGLVLNLDAGNTESYPGTGNTWIDLSGNGNNGTMSGATYSAANGGSILISGSSYVNLGDPTTLRFGTGDWTYECWVKTGNLGTNTLISKGYSPGFEAFWYGGLLSVWISGAGANYTGSWSNNTWYHIVFSKINGVYYVYKNGTSFGQTNSTSDISASGTNWWIGQRTGGDYTLNGNISVTRMYNKGLSAAEVLQNYNALKSRYGL
jgi:hypothetical protein